MKRSPLQKTALLLAAVLLALGLSACAGGSSAANSPEAAYDAAPQAAPGVYSEGLAGEDLYAREEESYSDDAAPAEGGEAGASPTLTAPADERKIILNAYLTVESLEFDKTLQALQRACDEAGGYISATDLSGSAEKGTRTANITYRIPAEGYAAFVQSAGSAGNLISRNESSNDVTSQYVDIESRLKSLRTQEERLLALMEESGSLEELLMVQDQLTDVQYEIESYMATQRSLDGQISYSTVTVYLSEVKEITETEPDSYWARISRAFSESWKNAATFFQDFSIVLVYMLPALLILGVLALVIVLLARRAAKRRREKQAKNPPPAWAPPAWNPQQGGTPPYTAPQPGYAPPPEPAPAPDTPANQTPAGEEPAPADGAAPKETEDT